MQRRHRLTGESRAVMDRLGGADEAAAPLSVLVCGSVDDGKSTLIGRLLTDCGAVLEDQVAAELAHLTDGLEAEREQGITIDVAHRHFFTGRRRVRLLDCPGHEQYTRNMATGASQAELAVVLVDAVLGVRQQTRRHVLIARLMGVRQVVFVVNKMDLVGFDRSRFEGLAAELRGLDLAAAVLAASALGGEGVTRALPGFGGPTLLEVLDGARVEAGVGPGFRMAVQMVLRGADGERLLAGRVASGRVRVGEAVAVSGAAPAVVRGIAGTGGAQEVAEAGESVTIALAEPRDAGRGTVLSDMVAPVGVADQFQAHVVWCGDAPLLPGRTYLFKVGTAVVAGSVNRIRHAVDVDTGLPLAAKALALNEIGVVNLSLAGVVAFERFADCPALGGFIVIDRASGATVAAGTIDFALTRSDNVAWQAVTVDRAAREGLLGQRGAVVWFTGLSGAGKSTVANRVEAMLHGRGRATYLLDGDNLRHGLNRDLGFTEADRVENVRRVGEVAALMADAGLIVLVCLISPYRADRAAVRERVGVGFVEVFVDADVAECRRRDPKGLYEKADRGVIPNFTGVSAPYEAPEGAEVHVRTDRVGVEEAAAAVLGRVLS